MSSKADFFLKKTLGDGFFESLQKFELWKPGTRTTVDHEEIRTALKIVPRVLMAVLIRELTPMQIGETKEITLPVDIAPALIRATKNERDVYTGVVEQDNKVVVDFKYRSIPGIGLVVMSAFELYDVNELHTIPEKSPNIAKEVQQIIDERLALYDLVNKVVDKKLSEKDAVQQLLLARVTEMLEEKKIGEKITDVTDIAKQSAHSNEYFRGMANGLIVADAIANDKHDPEFVDAPKKAKLPLDQFFEKRKNKQLKKNEFSIQLAKGEQINCPDCGGNIFDGQIFSGCICVGDDREKKVYLKKTEDGIKVRFSKSWDQENIEMLLEVLRKKNE